MGKAGVRSGKAVGMSMKTEVRSGNAEGLSGKAEGRTWKVGARVGRQMAGGEDREKEWKVGLSGKVEGSGLE